MSDRTTLSISTQTHERLNKLKERIERILGKKISLDQTLSVILAVKHLDEVLEDMILERGDFSG